MRKRPPSPSFELGLHNRDLLRDYTLRDETLAVKKEELSERSLGNRLFCSGALRRAIRDISRRQTTMKSIYPDLFTPENVALYTKWTESLIQQAESIH